ncbi:hypothetical protein BDDG_04267 [Blastomyces dermatitidis ATCC 18188]|uniref:Uncharacterized protein n=1 Tax=Ajellomyces dermatitidis (strain ATCC 18188 / CBS 674.68) TaxID=653446 RepID=F2TDL3_AJEDA|nr:hypothetical protein BDDG_04267 [Blastomyces dermatitidis ATCC 18188]EQL36984.1 hypothetical protein BDFG_01609 [Blastomyces dermatitidis ATCC 26199]
MSSTRRTTIPDRPKPNVHVPCSNIFFYGIGAGIMGVAATNQHDHLGKARTILHRPPQLARAGIHHAAPLRHVPPARE